MRLEALFRNLPVDDGDKADLLARVSSSARIYHGVGHLAGLWQCHTRYASAAGLDDGEAARLVACAIAYHDLIYDSGSKDNELLSAETWLDVASRCRVAPHEARWVGDTIRATRDHLAYMPDPSADSRGETLRLWFLDLDLTPLGETPAIFRCNAMQLRCESPQLTDAAWADANLVCLRKTSAAPRIFRSPVLFSKFEQRARANIAAAIARHGWP